MAPLDLDGETLGAKRKNYNKLLKEAIANNETVPSFKLSESDVQNLFNVDLACHNRDVNYILEVFKCGDMLCVSRAISQSTWLITEQQYSNIINPEYIQKELYPHMCTKAYIKLHKHIRLNIKDELRAEKFYLQETKKTEAIKWLPYCSVTFIGIKIREHFDHINIRIWKRLCERSINIFEIVFEHSQRYKSHQYAQAVLFLLKVDLDKYLDLLEKDQILPKFNDKATHVIMKKSPQRVFDKFHVYMNSIDVATFSKYLKPEEIFTFLCTQINKDANSTLHVYRSLFDYDTLKHFVRRMPKDEQFDFVKKVFIVKQNADIPDDNLVEGTEAYFLRKMHNYGSSPSYLWYRFATFERAFEDITQMLDKGVSHWDKNHMLKVLVLCANNNMKHIYTLLDYYIETNKNESHSNKFHFTTEVLKGTSIYKYDEKTWNKLNELFNSMMIYDEGLINIHYNECLFRESIIIYKVIHDEKVPEVIENKFQFNTLQKYVTKLNEEQGEKVFRYLYERLLGQFKPIKEEVDLLESFNLIKRILKLLKDWNKELQDYSNVLDKIKELIKIRETNSWKHNLSSIYNFKKSWRRLMFEESIVMHPSEAVCLNALKHDPRLLERYNNELQELRVKDTVYMRKLLAKFRTFWSRTFAQNWAEAYLLYLMERNDQDSKKKASVRGLCTILTQEPLSDIVEKYKPAQAKIDWNTVDDHVLNIQRLVAKNMHRARPQPPPDSILAYAKGDYLQFALPSLIAIFYNLNISQSKIFIPKLLDAPVSIQKHGIRFAYRKLNDKDSSTVFLNCWKSSKNVSIRAIIFKFTHELLCKETHPDRAVALWELIEMFIDSLTFEEDKKIYELLAGVDKIPINVRANYLMKCYKFMNSLIANAKETNRDQYIALRSNLIWHSRQIMERLCPDFVVDLIQEHVDDTFFESKGNGMHVYVATGIVPVLSAYVLCTKDENLQMQRYEQVLLPLLKRALTMWEESRDGHFYIRSNFMNLINQMQTDLRDYAVENNMNIPLKMFKNIQTELHKSLSLTKNYVLLTRWKLMVALTVLVEKAYPDLKDWMNVTKKIAPEFGKLCLQYLKEDVTTYMPCIYKLFSEALNHVISLLQDDEKKEIYDAFLSDEVFIQGYLLTIQMNGSLRNNEELKEKLLSHPSVEVKMHYYDQHHPNSRYLF